MSDVWSKDGTLPEPFQHFIAHLENTSARLRSGLDSNLPVVTHRRGELDDAVAKAVDPSAETARQTLREFANMPALDEERVKKLRSVLDRQEEAAMDQATRFGTGNSR
ncbi:hypothetical protein [Micromonospora radicis]|nr:hypothetical protein [Micromonospora radicis]